MRLLGGGDLAYMIGICGVDANAIFVFTRSLNTLAADVRYRPHIGGAAIGVLVKVANCSQQTVEQLQIRLDFSLPHPKILATFATPLPKNDK